MDQYLQAIYTSILEGDSRGVRQGVEQALEMSIPPGTILSEGMIVAMKDVGYRFETGEYFVPEMLISARAMKEGLLLLKPMLVRDNVRSSGTVVIGTVKGDLHDIGKNLVSMMLEGAGFEVVDLGTDVAPEKFVEALRDNQAGILAMSALLTTTMPNMKVVMETLQVAGLRDRVKVMVGGAPVTESYATQIGADGYAPDASRAAAVAGSLLE